jgi:hypothetical protein
MEPNGSNPTTRFERIERLLEKMVNSYVHFVEQHGRLLEEHERFTGEHKGMLNSQVVLAEQMTRLVELQRQLADALKHTDERMNALIDLVNGTTRSRRIQ